MDCEKCNQDMKLIPAGVSKKTQKPYDAFYSCQNKDCNFTKNAGAEANVKNFNKDLHQPDERKYWGDQGMAKAYTALKVAEIRAGKEVDIDDAMDKIMEIQTKGWE